MLILRAEVWGHGPADIRIASGLIAEIGTLAPAPGETVLEANGGALLPGLHDHHIHLAATAARASSVQCGPPEITTHAALAARLATVPGEGWLRGIGYHESVMGLPDAAALDALVPHRPLRLQHRSGRMWLLNSRALALLLAAAPPPLGLERTGKGFTGRLFDEDEWLRTALGSSPPGLAQVSAELARCGVTGVTDMSPRNDAPMAAHFAAEAQAGHLRQRLVLAGTLALADAPPSPYWSLGPAKLHLHENALPDIDDTAAFIASAHAQNRAVAVHCTTETELVFTLAALAAAGPRRGDRIEHAGIAPDHLVAEIACLGLWVVSQPHFIAERGDRYLADVEAALHPALYRLRAFAEASVPLAAGSDAPFGTSDPWASMRAAVSRRTLSGASIGAAEALDPETALSLYLADPADLTRQRRIEPGAPADLCLLSLPWAQARTRLLSADVRAAFVAGWLVFDNGIDKAP
jgi:predicted amidohydrolase YtcJ